MEDLISVAIKNTQDLYLSDGLPWVVGYSGGKDSTATLQLVWRAISEIPEAKRTKPIYVISTDTLVENPVVAIWVTNSLETMRKAAQEQHLPIEPHRLTPELKDRFWVNLIGRGYPAPRPKFRWCTERLKISASNKFITDVANKNGEAIVVLGTRRAESIARDRVLNKYEKSTRELLSRNSNAGLDRMWIYAPIANWSNDNVWEYLIENENPWGYDNLELFHIYRGATPDAECPLVVDKSTPSCGDSRFGCFVCTMVTEDKSMQAMIQNNDDKKWMMPLLEFRNEFLKTEGDRKYREFTRMGGQLTLHDAEVGKANPNSVPARDIKNKSGELRTTYLVHGPYTQQRREELLRALLEAQVKVDKEIPPEIGGFELISIEEIEEIRRIWVNEKHEFEDSVPSIYEEVFGKPYPTAELDESTPFRPTDMRMLKEVCSEAEIDAIHSGPYSPQHLHFRLLRDLLHVQHGYRSAIRRVGLQADLEKVLDSGSFDNEDQALDFAIKTKGSGAEFTSKNNQEYLTPNGSSDDQLEGEVEL